MLIATNNNFESDISILSTLFGCTNEDLIRDIQNTPRGEWVQHCFSMKINQTFFNMGLYLNYQGKVLIEIMYKNNYETMEKYGDFLHFSFPIFIDMLKKATNFETGTCFVYGKEIDIDIIKNEIEKMEQWKDCSSDKTLEVIQTFKKNLENIELKNFENNEFEL